MVTKSQVKYIQSLGQKKFRDETGVFVAEGPKIINELLGLPHIKAEAIYATLNWIEEHSKLVQAPGIVHEVTASELERCSFLTTPNEVLGIFKKPALPASFAAGTGIILMLDGIQDPGNMGSIIRIADWFGIRQVICSNDCADAFGPKVIQSTMASIARVEVRYMDLLPFVEANKDLRLYAATLQGKPVASFDKLESGVIVIGNESKGVNPALIAVSQYQVTIPRIGSAESLNAAVATGILLHSFLF